MTLPDVYRRESDDGGPRISERSRGVGVALGIIGGWIGLHRFYVGKTGTGVAMIFTLGGFGMWWLYDMILLASGEFRDVHDLPLRRWTVDEPPYGGRGGGGGAGDRRVNQLEDRVDQLNTELSELAERVDFAERMLAQQRERQLPRT